MSSSLAPAQDRVEDLERLSWPWRLVAFVVSCVAWLVAHTLRVTITGPEPESDRPVIFVFQHGRQMGLLRYPRPKDVIVLSSLSRDGSLQARILAKLGFRVARGSSSRGGAEGLTKVIRAIRKGASAAIAVDGPRGPLGEVKLGALFMARATNAVIIPITCAASSAISLKKSWDRFQIPVPWSRVLLMLGDPLVIPRRTSDSALEDARARLELDLTHLTERADNLVRHRERNQLECLG